MNDELKKLIYNPNSIIQQQVTGSQIPESNRSHS